MAEWFVDPASGLTSNAGTQESPWKLIPGQAGATSQTGYAVAAGDTINVRNGTSTALRIVAPANNLTYRGYGIADNVLWLTLPSGLGTALVRVVRERGVHEGMWVLDDGNNGTYIAGAKHFGGVSMNPASPDIGAHRYFEPRALAESRRVALLRG